MLVHSDVSKRVHPESSDHFVIVQPTSQFLHQYLLVQEHIIMVEGKIDIWVVASLVVVVDGDNKGSIAAVGSFSS